MNVKILQYMVQNLVSLENIEILRIQVVKYALLIAFLAIVYKIANLANIIMN